MFKFVAMAAFIATTGCKHEEEELVCETVVECTDERESLCDPATVYEYPDGEIVEIRACTYITYESCFEKLVCTPQTTSSGNEEDQYRW